MDQEHPREHHPAGQDGRQPADGRRQQAEARREQRAGGEVGPEARERDERRHQRLDELDEQDVLDAGEQEERRAGVRRDAAQRPTAARSAGPAARAATTTPPAARTTAFRALVQSPLKVLPAIAFGQCRHSDQPRIRTAACERRLARPAAGQDGAAAGHEQHAGDVGDQVLLRRIGRPRRRPRHDVVAEHDVLEAEADEGQREEQPAEALHWGHGGEVYAAARRAGAAV